MTHLVITEHDGVVPAARRWEWVGAGAGAQQGTPAKGGSALSAAEHEGTRGSVG